MNRLLYLALLLTFSMLTTLQAQEAKKDAPKPAEKKAWTHSSGAGVTITSGNSETTTANLSHNSTWEKDKNKLTISVTGAYGVKETEDDSGNKSKDEFVNNINEKAQFNRKFSDSFYWYIVQGAEEDRIANLEYRLSIGPGVGYSVFKRDPFKLDVEAGAVYINEKLKDKDAEDIISGRIAEKFTWMISDTANLWLNAEALLNLEESDDFRINAELGIDVKINQNWLIRSSIQDKFYNNADSDTEKNDIIFMTSVVFKY